MPVDAGAQPRDARYTLGVNIGFHDSSAALLRDGALVAMVEQEKVSRRKHALGQAPVAAIQECLALAGVDLDSLAGVAIGWDINLTRMAGRRRFSPVGLRALLFPDAPAGQLPPVTWVRHHLAHAASAYYACGEDNVAIIVIDGAGENQCTSLLHGRDGRIELLREWPIDQSLGFFYASASKWAGLGEWGAGKLMGLAAYGRPSGSLPLRALPDGYALSLDGVDQVGGENGGDLMTLSFPPAYEAAVRSAFACHYPYTERQGEDAMSYTDFAASVQQALEDAVLSLAAEARRRVDAPTLVLAGGVGMNCTMIGRLVDSGLYDRVYVPPVPTDVGVSFGAALVEARDSGVFTPVPMDHAYWSTPFTDVERAISDAGLVCRPLAEAGLARVAARTLADGGVVAWARGRGEVGQRALGTRSLLADPRDRGTWERLNIIKGREMWRPIAPSVLEEHLAEIFPAGVGDPAAFMLAASSVAPSMRRVMPATTHVDGSARPQRVQRATNPAYWQVIEEFRQLTGVPAVANTSFNLAGEPIVYTAADAVSTFVRAKDIDLLVLDRYVVARGYADLPEDPVG
ncbi:carbamoyltransferase family protein [Luedemannella helvata]